MLGQEGASVETVGRSRGGRISRIDTLASVEGKPVAFVLKRSNVADIRVAAWLLDDTAPPQHPAGRRGHDADQLREQLQTLGPESRHPVQQQPSKSLSARSRRLPQAQRHRARVLLRHVTRCNHLFLAHLLGSTTYGVVCFIAEVKAPCCEQSVSVNTSSIDSAGSFLSRTFSFSSDLSRFALTLSMPPYFERQVWNVAPLRPCLRQRFGPCSCQWCRRRPLRRISAGWVATRDTNPRTAAMTDHKRAVRELLAKGFDTTFLREMLGSGAQRLMALET